MVASQTRLSVANTTRQCSVKSAESPEPRAESRYRGASSEGLDCKTQSGEATHVKVYAALEGMLEAGIEAGLFRSDITVDDVAGALSGFSLPVGSPGSKERADRLVRLLVDGLRYGAPPT